MEQFKVIIKQDYMKLLDLLAHVLAADNYLSFGDADENERLSIARGLTDKFVNHAVTLLYLSRGTDQGLISYTFKSKLFDFASIDVLTRVLLEACLTFHYVFYAPTTKGEKDYRYWAYKAAAIVERRDFPASSEGVKRKIAEEEKELDKLIDKLKSNTIFQGLAKGKKAQFLTGKNRDLWRWTPATRKVLSWREIAIDAGFSEMMASKIYRYLSGVAHSGFLSVFLSVETQRSGTQKDAIINAMSITNAVIANMIREYCGLFPRAQELWNTAQQMRETVNWWIQLDRGLDENL